MRWIIVSILLAIVLSLFGLWVSDPLAGNVAPKAIFWLGVGGFLLAEMMHFCGWVRKRDL